MQKTKFIAVHWRLQSSAITDKPSDASALWWMTAIYWPNFATQSFTRGQLLTAYRPDFPTFTYPSPIWLPQWGRSPQATGFMFGMGKLEWLSYRLMKVAWWPTQSFGHNASTWQTDRQPRCRVYLFYGLQSLHSWPFDRLSTVYHSTTHF